MVPPELRKQLVGQARLVVENARAELPIQSDVERVEEAASWMSEIVGATRAQGRGLAPAELGRRT